MNDKEYMPSGFLQLAKRVADGRLPNPMVGARGRKGQDHRTGLAPEYGQAQLRSAMRWHPAPKIRRATLYVTLGRLCHFGSGRPAWMRFWTQAFTGWSWVLL